MLAQKVFRAMAQPNNFMTQKGKGHKKEENSLSKGMRYGYDCEIYAFATDKEISIEIKKYYTCCPTKVLAYELFKW